MPVHTVREEVTYAGLVNLINTSALTPEARYTITDYATKHYVVDADGTQYLDTVITGETEPLVVTATGVSTIDLEVKSSLYPQDRIQYDWNPANWNQDLSFADVTTDSDNPTIVPGFKGVIYFRHDTLLDNKLSYDFRNVKFRRWKTSTPVWSEATTYDGSPFSKVTYAGFIYQSLTFDNINQQPDTSPSFWTKIVDLGLIPYSNNAPYDTNDILSDPSQYIDVKTFAEGTGSATYEICCRNNHFDGLKDDNNSFIANATICSNNVFFLKEGAEIFANSINGNNNGNTFSGSFHHNSIGASFFGNIIGDTFQNNTIEGDFNDNTIYTSFYFNLIGNGFTGNTIGDGFNSNTVNRFQINVVGSGFLFNSVLVNMSQNSIGSNFTSNIIGGFQANTVSDNFQNNTVIQGKITNVDFRSSTHVYASYNTSLFKNSAGVNRLSYYNASDVLTVVNPTA